MISFSKDILKEGRYDSLSRQISNDIFYVVKETKGSDEVIEAELPSDLRNMENYLHESGVDIVVGVYVNRLDRLYYGDKHLDFFVKSYIDESDELVLEITLDRDKEPQSYEPLFYKINEDVRHEIEHYTQAIMKDKPSSDKATAQMDSTYEHHMEPSEISALVHGFYRRAKLEKKPLDVIMWDDLNNDIEVGHLTQEEADDLFHRWISYSRRRLPNAIYSTN
jgi:hypothetical protein